MDEALDFWRSEAESSGAAAIVVDRSREIRSANREAAELTGFTLDQLLDASGAMLLAAGEWSKLSIALSRAFGGETVRGEGWKLRKLDESTQEVTVRLSPVTRETSVLGVLMEFLIGELSSSQQVPRSGS